MPKARSPTAIPTKCRKSSISGRSAATPNRATLTGCWSRLKAKAEKGRHNRMRWKVLSGGAALLVVAGLLSACTSGGGLAGSNKAAMAPIAFNEIPGWSDDKLAEALATFRRSCPRLTASPDTRIATDGGERIVTAAEWRQICTHAAAVRAGDDHGARQFFEQNFRPLVVQGPARFTGYFEPELRGSRAPSRVFTIPVYRRPADLSDKPYYTRAEIEQGALKGK